MNDLEHFALNSHLKRVKVTSALGNLWLSSFFVSRSDEFFDLTEHITITDCEFSRDFLEHRLSGSFNLVVEFFSGFIEDDFSALAEL